MSTRIFGSGIKRREDPRLITGKAKYTDDIYLPGTLHMVIVRSPYAHARIRGIDTSAAKYALGRVAVFSGTGVPLINGPCAWLVPDFDLMSLPHPSLAKDTVRCVRDGEAAVIADTRSQAPDAAALIQVDYEPPPTVLNPAE